MIMRAPVESGTEAVITLQPDIDDLVPSEASPRQMPGDPTMCLPSRKFTPPPGEFFADQNISPKADRTMWVKISVGLAILLGSWIALYALKPDSWRFVALYLLSGLAQTFLLLNIAHDSNHNAISSVSSVNKTLNYVFDVCGISSYMWRILHHRGHTPASISTGKMTPLRDAASFGLLPMSPARAITVSSTSTPCFSMQCSLSTTFS